MNKETKWLKRKEKLIKNLELAGYKPYLSGDSKVVLLMGLDGHLYPVSCKKDANRVLEISKKRVEQTLSSINF